MAMLQVRGGVGFAGVRRGLEKNNLTEKNKRSNKRIATQDIVRRALEVLCFEIYDTVVRTRTF